MYPPKCRKRKVIHMSEKRSEVRDSHGRTTAVDITKDNGTVERWSTYGVGDSTPQKMINETKNGVTRDTDGHDTFGGVIYKK